MSELAPGLNIRLQDGLPGGGSAFVEIEDDHGNSIKIGKVTRYLGGAWSIRITAEDIAKLPPPKLCQLRDQVAAGHRVQLAVAGQWLGHAAEKLGDAPAAAYLQALAEWLTGNAEGDEPEAPGG